MGPVWFGLILVLWAPLVALARVSMGVHYISDVLAGGFLGLIIGIVWILILG
jgi:undecaprenyl-diphosphatase